MLFKQNYFFPNEYNVKSDVKKKTTKVEEPNESVYVCVGGCVWNLLLVSPPPF